MQNSSDSHYEVIIFWSAEDNTFFADVPELPGCTAHEDSYEKALKNANTAMKPWIKTPTEIGDTIPQPKGKSLLLA